MTETRSGIIHLDDAMDAVFLTTMDQETGEPRVNGIVGICWDHREIVFFQDMEEIAQWANGRDPVETTNPVVLDWRTGS